MTFMELAAMSNEDQTKWMSEHSFDEFQAIFDEWLESEKQQKIEYNVNRFRERRKMREIAKAVMDGRYSGITSDGKPWRIDFSDSHVDDWRDQYYNSDYEY